MENQGKRKDQIDFSEKLVYYGMIGIIFIIGLVLIEKILKNLWM
jgi:hypothetical protein